MEKSFTLYNSEVSTEITEYGKFYMNEWVANSYGVSLEVINFYVYKYGKRPGFYLVETSGKAEKRRELKQIERFLKLKKIREKCIEPSHFKTQ